jgi:ketosteroid isomerase-like protein
MVRKLGVLRHIEASPRSEGIPFPTDRSDILETTMNDSKWVNRLFAAIDGKDAAAFADFLTEDAVFRFGNAAPVSGKAAIRETVAGFFGSIRALRHEVTDAWTLPDVVVAVGQVTYTRHDGSTLSVPFADVFRMRGELAREYLIYVDASRLYAP